MTFMLMQQEVADYTQWRPVFDSNEAVRRSRGVQSTRVFRGLDNPNTVTLLVEWDDIEHAKSWLNDARLHAAMQAAGVLSAPVVTFLNES